ncbi:MAG: PadR family transcriptional regulator [Candidatus Micrarchaeia archaeon]
MEIKKKCNKVFSSYFKNELKRMLIKIFILKIIKKKKIYSYALIKEISKHEHFKHFVNSEEIKNDVYNAVSALEKEGYIKVSNKKDHIKYYEITKKGNDALTEINKNFKEAWRRMRQIIK